MLQYSAVPQTDGAPLRTVTVKDVISDLPPITNGHSVVEMEYSGEGRRRAKLLAASMRWNCTTAVADSVHADRLPRFSFPSSLNLHAAHGEFSCVCVYVETAGSLLRGRPSAEHKLE